MEEEAQKILRSALDGSAQKVPNDSTQSNSMKLTSTEKRLRELEERGVLLRSARSPKRFPRGSHVPGALDRFLAERRSE